MTQPIPKPSGRVDDENRDMAITETGRTETVAGVSCRVYETTTMTKNGVQKGEACFAKGIGLQLMDVYASFMGTAPFASGNATWDKLKAQDMQLLKVVSLKDGKPDHIVTAVKIDRTPVPASMFKPPEGFTRMEP